MNQAAAVLLLLILPILFFLMSRVRAGKTGTIRRFPGMEELPDLVGRSAETGQPLHISVGVEGLGGSATAETWAGLTLLAHLADEAAASDAPLVVTVSDPTVLPLAQDLLQRAYLRQGNPEGYSPTQVQFIAPEPMAYAAGVMGMLARDRLGGNIMVGSFGDEYLLMGEVGAHRGLRQIVGTADPRTLPLVYASADETLIGEEMFAGGAYTSREPIQVASLLAADWVRWLVIAVILGWAVAKLLLG